MLKKNNETYCTAYIYTALNDHKIQSLEWFLLTSCFIIFCIFCSIRQQQAVVEKFALCEDHLSKLLEWITKVEQDIATVGGPKERVDDLRNQINSLKVNNSEKC